MPNNVVLVIFVALVYIWTPRDW